MNSTNCPYYYATDTSFLRTSPPCSTDLRIYWAVTLSIVLLKCIPAVYFTYSRLRRRGYDPLRIIVGPKTQNNKLNNKSKSKSNRTTTATNNKNTGHPIPLYFAWLNSFCIAASVICLGINVANVNNGISFALYSLGYLTMSSEKIYQLFKTVRLGIRLVPRRYTKSNKSPTSNHNLTISLAQLQQFDIFGQFSLLIQALSVLISCIALMIFSPLYPMRDREIGITGFWTKFSFMIFYIFSMGWHMQRIKLVVQHQAKAISIPEHERESYQQRLNLITFFITRSQFAAVIGGSMIIIPFLLLALEIVPWTWWILFIPPAVETVTSFLVTFLCLPKSSRYGSKSTSTRTANHTGEHNQQQQQQYNHHQQQQARKSHTNTKSQSHPPSSYSPGSLVLMETLQQVKNKLRNYRVKGKKQLAPILSTGDGDDDNVEDGEGFPPHQALNDDNQLANNNNPKFMMMKMIMIRIKLLHYQ
jgi:MFS family permease